MQKSPLTEEPQPKNQYIRSILTISEPLSFKDEMEDDVISTFISSPNFVSDSTCQLLESIMSCTIQEAIELEIEVENISIISPHNNILVDIDPGKTLNVNPNISSSQSEQLLKVLRD